jgi:hypothetical protein
MSAAAVFLLIANDGKSDRMIMATQLLNQRIKDIMQMRRAGGKSDITPTLVDIERTHLLYVNAHFKPYAAIAYEYNKVRPQTGGINFGNSMQFSIPQFGDFFFDMVVNVGLPSVTGTKISFPSTPPILQSFLPSPPTPPSISSFSALPSLPTEPSNPFTTPTSVSFPGYSHTIKNQHSPYSNQVMNGKSDSTTFHSYVQYQFTDALATGLKTDLSDPSVAEPTGLPSSNVPVNNLVHYCEYPGHFLFPSIKFDVNGNPLDQYSNIVSIMSDKVHVPPNKRWGYNTLIGQQNTKNGTGSLFTSKVVDYEFNQGQGLLGGLVTAFDPKQSGSEVCLFNNVPNTPLTGNSQGGNNVTALNALSPAAQANPADANSAQTSIGQNLIQVVDGPQTPKPTQPPLSLWIPLQFWFNKSVSLAIPSVSIPYGQRFITFAISESQSSNSGNLYYQKPGAFLKRTLMYNSKAPNVPITSLNDVDTVENDYTAWGGPDGAGEKPSHPGISFPAPISNGLNVTSPLSAELYINNIFVNPEIHDIYIKRIGFSLIRVHREQNTSLSGQGNSEVLLSALKWPIEYMYIALQPSWNKSSVQNPNASRDWHRFSKNLSAFPTTLLTGNNYSESVPSGPSSSDSTSTFIGQNSTQGNQYWIPSQTTDALSIISHGITIFDNFPSTFYNAYLPFKYSDPCWITPEDNSLMFITFCLFPGSYQPSGHLNISRARETYVNVASTYVSSNGRCNFNVVASAINFLLISDGSAVLRYST